MEHDCDLVGVGMGAPGRFRNGVILPGTSPNMGDPLGTEFDNVNLQGRLAQVIGIPIFVKNDASTEAMALVQMRLAGPGRTSFLGKTVGVFTFGTGLGNAFVKIEKSGAYKEVTDGHMSKHVVPVSAELAQALKGKGVHISKGHMVMVEHVVSGEAIKKLMGYTGQELMETGNEEKREAYLAMSMEVLGNAIIRVREGDSMDIRPEQHWTPDFVKQAKETSIYLVSGGMGRAKLGELIVERTNGYLQAKGYDNITLMQETGMIVAPRAAAMLVPPELLKGQAKHR